MCGSRFSSMNNKTKGEREICPKCQQGKVDPTYEASIDNYIANIFNSLFYYISVPIYFTSRSLYNANFITKIFLIKIFDRFSFTVSRHKT